MAYPTSIYGKAGWEKQTTTTKKHRLGTRMELRDGRVFYYALATGVIGAGKLVMQNASNHASHISNLAVKQAHAVGRTDIVFTNAGSAFAKTQLNDGYVFVNDVDGEGHVYAIREAGNTASGRNNIVGITDTHALLILEEDDGIAEALTTNSQLGIRTNKFLDAQLWDNTAIDGICLGAAPTEIADNEYFWCQSWGSVALWTNGTVILGKQVIARGTGATQDGSVRKRATVSAGNTAIEFQNIGTVESVAATTEYSLIFLTISR